MWINFPAIAFLRFSHSLQFAYKTIFFSFFSSVLLVFVVRILMCDHGKITRWRQYRSEGGINWRTKKNRKMRSSRKRSRSCRLTNYYTIEWEYLDEFPINEWWRKRREEGKPRVEGRITMQRVTHSIVNLSVTNDRLIEVKERWTSMWRGQKHRNFIKDATPDS